MKEIERRVALDEYQAKQVIADLDARGAKWKRSERMMVDFSEGLEDRKRTVVVRVDDGDVELVVKSGGAATVTRQEASVDVASGLESALHTMALLGYTKASCGLRSMQKCELDGIEYSLRNIRDYKDPAKSHGYNFEVELTREGTVDEIDQEINNLGLEPLGEDETIAWFKRLHAEANADYEYSDESVAELAALASKYVSG